MYVCFSFSDNFIDFVSILFFWNGRLVVRKVLYFCPEYTFVLFITFEMDIKTGVLV